MRQFWLWCILVVCTLPAHAHQQRVALTDIVFNQRSGNIEVAHRFIIHDAEHALRDILGHRVDLHADAKKRDEFAAYVARRFSLGRLGGEEIPLTLLGHEVDGGFLWVYQETPLVEGLKGLSVQHTSLQDVWRDQVNTVNVRRGNAVRTLQLTSESSAGSVTFDQ